MDQKQCHWGKKPREKTILETDKPNHTSKQIQEVQTLLAEKENLENELKRLNDKLIFTISECNAKDEHMKKQTKIVQEAVSGWEKAESEMLLMKEHLEESIHEQLVYEERVVHLECALKECMQQLHFVREEQEQRIYDAVMKCSIEFDRARVVLEEGLSESSKRICTLNEQLCAVEEENMSLRESLNRKINEVQFSRVMLSQTASKLLKLESEIESKNQLALDWPRSNIAPQDLSSVSISEIESNGNVSCAESSASALISKESFSCRSFGPSDINLMDDFIEMEKLAVVSDIHSDFSMSNKESCSKDSCRIDASNAENLSVRRGITQCRKDLNKSIGKMIELIEGINVSVDYNNQGAPTGYMVRVFQWKTSDLSDILQSCINVCYSLLNGDVDPEKFATELTKAFEWIINHCFSIRDVSSMEDAIKKQFDWSDDETQSEKEAEKLQTNMNLFQESEKTISGLRLELQTLKESNRKLEVHIQNDASVNNDHNTRLIETELQEAYHKILALEVELESRNHYCDELDTKCVELQLQLESMKRVRSSDYVNQKNEPEWEITVASEKLAECQETILNLEKQLKAMTTTKDMSIFDNIIAAHRRPIVTNTTTVNVPLKDVKFKNRPSLLDQMLAEDDAKTKACEGSERNFVQPVEKIVVLKGVKGCDEGVNVDSLAILPVKKSGRRSLWRKMVGARRKQKRKQVYQFNK